MKQRVTAIRAGDEDVGASVVVEIAEGRVAAAPRDPIGVRERGERPVEVVAIHGERSTANQHQIEIAVMIDVDEHRAASAIHVAQAGGLSDILEPLAVAVAQQIAVVVCPNREQVEPAVVVVVGERRRDDPGRQRQRHLVADVGNEAAVHGIEVNLGTGHEEVGLAVAVVISQGERSDRAAAVRKPTLAGDIGEPHFGGGGRGRDAAHRDERRRIEGQHRPAGQRPFHPIDLRQRRLVRGRDFDQA